VNGKGSKIRKDFDRAKYREGWDRIFSKPNKNKENNEQKERARRTRSKAGS